MVSLDPFSKCPRDATKYVDVQIDVKGALFFKLIFFLGTREKLENFSCLYHSNLIQKVL